MINNLVRYYYENIPAQPKTIVDKTKLFRFDLAEGLFDPSPKVVKVLRKIKEESISTLPDKNSLLLKSSLGNFLGVKSSNLSVFSGSDEVIEIIPRMFLNSGDLALIIAPTFQRLIVTNLKVGASYQIISTNLESSFCLTEFNLESIRKLLKSNIKIVWMCTPNNPTGVIFEKSPILSLTRGFPKTLFVVNEVYQEYYSVDPKDSFCSHAPKLKNLIVIRSFSKAFGLAGMRVGYLVGNSEIVSKVESFRTMYNLSNVSQELAVAALDDINYVKEIAQYVRKERERIVDMVRRKNPKIELIDKSKTNLLFLRHKNTDLFDKLVKNGYAASDWRNAEGVKGQEFVRISVGKRKYNNEIIRVLSGL